MSNPIKHFLGIDTDPKAPDIYLIFKIEEHANAEQVAQAADAVISKVRAQRPGERKREWSALIDFLTKAKEKLMNERQVNDPTAVFDPPNLNASGKNSLNANSAVATNRAASSEAGAGSPTKKSRNKADRNVDAKPANEKAGSNYCPPSLNPTDTTANSRRKKSQAPIAAAGAGATLVGETSTRPRAHSNDTHSVRTQTDKAKTSKTKPAPIRDDDYSFTLDAPDEKDSFDSDTHLSGQTLQPAVVMATTIDPMAPIADPTVEWDRYDQIQLHQGVTNASNTNDQDSAIQNPNAAISEKTFYADTYRMKSRNGVLIAGTLVAMLVVGAVSYVLIFGTKDGSRTDESDGTEKVAENTRKDERSDNPTVDSSQELVSDKEKTTPPAVKPDAQSETSDASKTDPDSIKPTKQDLMPSGDPLQPEVKPDSPTPDSPTPDSPTPDSPTPDSPTPDSMDSGESTMVQNVPKPKNSEIAELASLLTSVRTKLLDRDLVEANRMLEKAGSLPMVPEHKGKFERLKTVTELYGKFWNMVVEGCGKLKGLDEIKFSETNIISVIESSEDRIIYRAIGKRFEKAPRELQIGIAMKIAEKDFDDTVAESRLIKGSVYAVEAFNDSDRAERAREIWEEAGLLGANTDELVLFLDDQYDLLDGFITRTKLPTPEEMKEAQSRFRTNYASESKTASRNAETSTAFATKLLADAVKLDDAADRHANFVAAVFYASKSGDAVFLMKALSDMNKWFTIDLDQKTLDSLATMNKMRLKPVQKREIARAAFEYMDRAKRANNQELELKFATLALAAAKGTRDQKFIATANRELQRVKASQK